MIGEYSKELQAKEDRIFVMQMEQFWKRWAPDDKYEASQFHAELSMLVRQTVREAQEPLLDQISKMAGAFPLFPQILSGNKP